MSDWTDLLDELDAYLDARAECADGVRGRERVLRGPEARDLALPVGDGAEEEGAVRDRLVPGNGEVASQRHRRLDPHAPSP